MRDTRDDGAGPPPAALAALLEEQRALLRARLAALGRLTNSLEFSRSKIPFPLTAPTLAAADEDLKESIAAFVQRFGAIQDLLGGAMKAAASLEGVAADDFREVVSFMEKVGVLADAQAWKGLRLLRNRSAHEYELAPDRQTAGLNALEAGLPMLLASVSAFADYCRSSLGLTAEPVPSPGPQGNPS